jgi:ATP-binding cassette, subfamily B, bacterial
VLKGGVVAEEGTHDELMAKEGVYAELYHIQFGKQTAEASATASVSAPTNTGSAGTTA